MTENASTVKARFEAEGVSVAAWARAHGFTLKTVYRVLDGSLKAKRGEAYRVAIALGIKAEPKVFHLRSSASA